MKKRFFVLFIGVLISLTLLCPCTDSKMNVSDVSVDVDASAPEVSGDWQVFSQENWKLFLPGTGWAEIENSIDEMKVSAQNPDKECLFVFIRENTMDTFPEYVMNTAQFFVDHGSRIYAANQVTINGNKFVLLQIVRKYEVFWIWTTVKNNFGYTLTCTGDIPSDPDAGLMVNQELCQSIANTVQIN